MTTTGAEPRARFTDLLAAEWLKLWSLRSMRWSIAGTALAVIALNANSGLADYNNWPQYGPEIRAHFVPGWAQGDSFTNNAGFVMMLITGCLGAVVSVSEYSTGAVRPAYAAVPARRSLLTAKAAVLTAVMLVHGTVVALGSFLSSQAILSGRGIGLSLNQPGELRPLVASSLLPAVCALIGLGLGVLIRHAATSTVTVAALLLLLPNFFNHNHHWSAVIDNAMPHTAWRRLFELDLPGLESHMPWYASVTGSWLVYLIWPLVSLALALAVVGRRDL
ncbi:ABC transporter permease [Kitasatospora sp. McL0602]|uniref:ABC transporter permease n=1 Tax=Kitasatospora sp. McL0602 TaxID=3439530 RepID=UPI003F8B0977